MSKRGLHAAYGALVLVLLAAALLGAFRPLQHRVLSLEQKRELLLALEKDIQSELFAVTGYRCCLHTPCSQCVGESPSHGEGARCDCLVDVVNGKYPCEECAGGILAGTGNPLLAEYFASSIADGIGREHVATVMAIVKKRYGIDAERPL